jgi:hypothetical protein
MPSSWRFVKNPSEVSAGGALGGERRRFPRLVAVSESGEQAELPARLIYSARSVQVLDISETGFLLQADSGLALGTLARLRFPFDGTPIAADIIVKRSDRTASSRDKRRYRVAALVIEWRTGHDQLMKGLARR